MADYGRELAFGTFLTPQSQRPGDVVALAQLTERAGLDLVSFQDHPYQPAFLDAWTLLSWVAAQTHTLKVAPNVLNLPLRQPTVVARAAASLDLLSGGRFELGLGTGAFWDGIESMGGQRLPPGQAVGALGEAIEVIRGIWDVTQRRGLSVNGEHYRVRVAKRGPDPAHDISIWLGAYKPRMLELTGAKADGWLPSLAYISPDQFASSNKAIDEAAMAAGRDPREVRRLLNVQGAFSTTTAGYLQGPPEQWTEQLLALALEHGFSTFILASDDPRDIHLFGEQVAPALREAVTREREAAGTQTGVARGPKALALRREGIDYDALPESLSAKTIEPGDKGYGKVRSTYLRPGSPGLVIRPDDAGDVRTALAFARAQDVPLSIRSGGHGISGRSTNDGGIVIDLGQLDQVEVLDRGTSRIRLGPGARWGNVAQELAPYGLGMSSGNFGDVGVGGLATTAGVGLLVRKHGLTIDHVLAAEVILADGTFVRADNEHHPDLFWALRGAGGNFGIVTAFELGAYPVRDVVFSVMLFDASPDLLTRWGQVIEQAPRELTSFLGIFRRAGSAPIAQLYTVYAGDDTKAAIQALTPLLSIGTLLDQQTQLIPYPAVIPPHGALHLGDGFAPASRSGLANHITPQLARSLLELTETGISPMVQIRCVGGAVNDIDPLATAYAHRGQNFSANAVAHSQDRLNQRWDTDVAPHLRGLYLSFDTDQRPERLNEAFPGQTLTRLRQLKARYDPSNVFNQNFPIPPATDISRQDTATTDDRP
jgi:alkanesulfonate monooxygenase SsuD/methylene tetrahydromethanopterin reductase-like flavin-dependent oxidoreductase (luciferase family)/FAD/FMN-containing dehydrogenase